MLEFRQRQGGITRPKVSDGISAGFAQLDENIVEPIDIRQNRRIILVGQGGVRGLMLSREPTTCAATSVTLDARPRQAGRRCLAVKSQQQYFNRLRSR